MSEVEMAELDYSYAPLPHALAAEMSISHGACRTWSIVHMLKWNRIEPDPKTIAELLGVSERSVFRWLQELEVSDWLTWNRHATNPHKRLLLRTGKQAADAARLAQIRALFVNGATPSIEEIRGLLVAPEPDDGGSSDDDDESGDGGIVNEPDVLEQLRPTDSGGRSDTRVISDTGGTCDPVGTSDTGITWGDSGVIACDTGIRSSDTRITPCDTGVILGVAAALPDASNPNYREVGVGGSILDSHVLIEPPTPRRGKKPRPQPPHVRTPLQNWLLDQEMMPDSARRFAHLDMAAAQSAFNEFMRGCATEDRFRRIGALVERWKERPPQPVPRSAARLFRDSGDAEAIAARVLPVAASGDRDLFVADLMDGRTEAEAMESYRERLARQRYLAAKSSGASERAALAAGASSD